MSDGDGIISWMDGWLDGNSMCDCIGVRVMMMDDQLGVEVGVEKLEEGGGHMGTREGGIVMMT